MRDFTVVRRRPNFVDIITPKRANVFGYRFQAATNFDASWTTLFTAPISSGYLDPAINPAVIHGINAMDQIRVVFNPNTFTGGASITDGAQFWLRFVPVDSAGSAGTPGPAGLILTDAERLGSSRIQIAGTAPQGVAVANSLQLDLPVAGQDFYVRNQEASGGRSMFIALSPGAPEVQIGPQETWKAFDGSISTLMVRGVSGTVNFSATFTNYLPL